MTSSTRAGAAVGVAAALALAGCGGGGGGGGDGGFGTDVQPAEGAYSGTLSGGTATAFDLVVLEDGTYWAMLGERSAGALRVTGFVQGKGVAGAGSTFASSDARDFTSAPAQRGSLSATFDALTRSITGTMAFAPQTLTFASGPIPASPYRYDEPAVLSTLAGAWSLAQLDGTPASLSVDDAGGFTATTATGCGFSGTARPRRSGRNVFDLALVFGPSPCSLPDQPASGIALAYPLAGGQTQLVVLTVDATRTMGVGAVGRR
ncbi:MAG TPA: hypothetical protein VFZ93_01755 [Albitalea sp.]